MRGAGKRQQGVRGGVLLSARGHRGRILVAARGVHGEGKRQQERCGR